MTIQSIFNAALDIADTAARTAFLDKECAGDPALRHRVEALLNAHFRDEDFLENGPAQMPTVAASTSNYVASPAVHTVIAGRYKIREKLGEGGMGAVYVVETVKDVKAFFALKLIKPGFDSRHVLARFEQERQALAMMNHPNIAKFIDAGVTESGQPYFVMELIKGLPITKYCDQEKLTVDERLNLFKPICQAVQHAHQKGIIHRDLKPGNILVANFDGVPVPKIIDFGVAKATLLPLTDKSIYSEIGSMIGTLEYMAPEQAEVNSLDIDTRADLYSLGVILYELLTGTVPFSRKELSAAAMLGMLKMIREDDPPKPSTKLSGSGSLPSVAAQRKIDPGALTRKLHGELDWIVMKCLEKERNRRYDGPTQLSQDIENYLTDHPLVAGPPSSMYRFKKFLKRNKGKALAAALLLVSLVAGIIGTTWGMVTAVRAEKVAETEAATAKAVQSFLENDLLRQVDVEEQAKSSILVDKDIKLRVLLDRAAETVSQNKFDHQPLVLAALEYTIGKAYLALGLNDKARPHLERSLRLREQYLGQTHPETLGSRLQWARYHLKKTEYQQAEVLLRSIVHDADAHDQTPIDLQEECKMTLAGALTYLSKYPEAEALYRELYQARQKRLTDRNRLTLQAGQQLAGIYRLQEKHQQAEELFLSILAQQRQLLGNENPGTLRTVQAMSALYIARQEFPKAEPFAQEAVTTGTKLYPDDHPMMMVYYNDLAAVQIRQQKVREAIATFAKLTELSQSRNGDDHASTIGFALNWASCLFLNKQYAEAEALYLKVRPWAVKRYGTDHGTYRRLLRSLAKVCETTNRLEAADGYWTELLNNCHQSKNLLPENLYVDLITAAGCKSQLRKTEELGKLLGEADTIKVGPSVEPYLPIALRRLQAELALLKGDRGEAKRRLTQAVDILKLDLAANPKRYQTDPFAIEERAALKKALEQWIKVHGQDVEMSNLLKQVS